MKLLAHVAVLPYEKTDPCPDIGMSVNISIAAGAPHIWGDIDCNGHVDTADVLALLGGVDGIPLDNLPEGCPAVGGGITIFTG